MSSQPHRDAEEQIAGQEVGVGAVGVDLGEAGQAFAIGLADSTWVLAALVAAGAVATWALVRRSPGPEPEAEAHPVHRLERRRLHL